MPVNTRLRSKEVIVDGQVIWFTFRELSLLYLLGDERSERTDNAYIAHSLSLSCRSVEKYMGRLMRKAHKSDRIGLAKLGYRLRYHTPGFEFPLIEQALTRYRGVWDK